MGSKIGWIGGLNRTERLYIEDPQQIIKVLPRSHGFFKINLILN